VSSGDASSAWRSGGIASAQAPDANRAFPRNASTQGSACVRCTSSRSRTADFQRRRRSRRTREAPEARARARIGRAGDPVGRPRDHQRQLPEA